MSKSFDFIDFLDNLQPHLDAVLALCYAIKGIDEESDSNLQCLKITLEYHHEQIGKICKEYLKKYQGEKL